MGTSRWPRRHAHMVFNGVAEPTLAYLARPGAKDLEKVIYFAAYHDH